MMSGDRARPTGRIMRGDPRAGPGARAEGQMNHFKVFVLMAGLTALFAAVGDVAGGREGMLVALALAAATNVGLYYASSSLVLRMYGAQVVREAEAPELHAIVDRLRRRAGLPMPTIAVAAHAQPNAFATGRDPAHAVVCVTAGMLGALRADELEAVLAHELAHVRSHDTLLLTVTATLAAAVAHLARLGLWTGGRRRGREGALSALALLVLAPVAATIIQLAVSRHREYAADAAGAALCGDPHALARALRKLGAQARQVPMDVSPAVAALALVDPLAARGGGIATLFATHPPIEARIARLDGMEAARPLALA
jgi:heat shock protein HtpX